MRPFSGVTMSSRLNLLPPARTFGTESSMTRTEPQPQRMPGQPSRVLAALQVRLFTEPSAKLR